MFAHDADPHDLDDRRPRIATDTDRELAAGCREVERARSDQGEASAIFKPAKPDYIPFVEGLLCECGRTMDSDFWCPVCGFDPPWG